jgi:hypothetical protein
LKDVNRHADYKAELAIKFGVFEGGGVLHRTYGFIALLTAGLLPSFKEWSLASQLGAPPR